jgi:hypothetical protein
MDIARASRRLLLATSLSLVTLGLLAAPATFAKGGADVIERGSCTGATDWKLKVSKDDGRIEVEFEVDQNRNGRTWDVALKQDGATFWSGMRTTRAPSGSFEVRKLATDRAGVHTFVGRAVNPATGEVCRGSARI